MKLFIVVDVPCESETCGDCDMSDFKTIDGVRWSWVCRLFRERLTDECSSSTREWKRQKMIDPKTNARCEKCEEAIVDDLEEKDSQ